MKSCARTSDGISGVRAPLVHCRNANTNSSDEHCSILNLKIGGGQSIECSRINQVKENLPISYGTFPGTLNKTFDHANLVYSPHLLYYIQGYIPASHETKHMAVLYVICMTSLLPLVMQRDVLHPVWGLNPGGG